jgi:hypothetical protein
MKHSAGLAILQGQSSLCRMIEISKLSKVDPFTKHPGIWWTVLAQTERELKPNIWPMLENRSLQMQGAARGVFVLRVHYDRRRWRKKKEEYQRKKNLAEFFFVFIGYLIQLQTHWFHDQILPLTIAILHHHSCCLGNSLLSLQRHHRYHQLLPTLLQHLAKQQDPKICPLSHNRTVNETIADERLSVVRLRRASPGYPPKHTRFFI